MADKSELLRKEYRERETRWGRMRTGPYKEKKREVSGLVIALSLPDHAANLSPSLLLPSLFDSVSLCLSLPLSAALTVHDSLDMKIH